MKRLAKRFAYYDTGHEFPEEIVMAAGFTPYKILGDVTVANDPADRYIHNYICPFSRSCLTWAMEHAGTCAGIAFCHGCDTTNNQFDIWKRHVDTPFLYWINTPSKNDKTARTYHKHELRRFITHLERQYGVTVTDEGLRDAIVLSNRIKALMRQLSALRSQKDIPNREYHDLTRACVEDDKALLVAHLEHTLSVWRDRPPFPDDHIPVLLTGSDITYPEMMDILDAANLRAVRDDLSLGERYFAATIRETGDPLEALVDYRADMPQPPTRIPFHRRLDYLKQCLAETNIRGIVYQILKFCEPHGLDLPYMTEELKKDGQRVLVIEREYTPTVDQQLVSRLESFREIIE